MEAHTWVERTVNDNERGTNNGRGHPCSVSSRAAPLRSPGAWAPLSLSYHSRSATASTTFVAIIQASADSCTSADHATTRKRRCGTVKGGRVRVRVRGVSGLALN